MIIVYDNVYVYVCIFSVQDISCNEIQVLPAQMGKLLALRELNIRRNCLQVLPDGIDIYTRQRIVNKSINQIKSFAGYKLTFSTFSVYASYSNFSYL